MARLKVQRSAEKLDAFQRVPGEALIDSKCIRE
jgi:hypothetical protein